jgi:hypothetical protein
VGRVSAMCASSNNQSPKVDVEIWDETGGVTLRFLGRREIKGISVGDLIVAKGVASDSEGKLIFINPEYTIFK